jgi:hypothetical protein
MSNMRQINPHCDTASASLRLRMDTDLVICNSRALVTDAPVKVTLLEAYASQL